jgi:leucyl-tRNA---protein transferase
MIVLHRFNIEETCMYLPDRPMRLEYAMVARLTPREYEERMNRGYRKFGPFLFHPACGPCRECRPIRIPVERFTPDRSLRRTLKRNADLVVRLAEPTVDAQRLALYNRYHAGQAAHKGWPVEEKDAEDYAFSFLNNPIPSVEISVWESDADGSETLRAVVLTEVTPNVVSGIYHYYEPDLRDRSIGAFAMLQTIELAKRMAKPYAYFGYYVAGSVSMAYKARFRPCELMDEDGVWREFTPGDTDGRDNTKEDEGQ